MSSEPGPGVTRVVRREVQATPELQTSCFCHFRPLLQFGGILKASRWRNSLLQLLLYVYCEQSVTSKDGENSAEVGVSSLMLR